MGYSNNYSGNHVDVSNMTTEEKKAYYEEQKKDKKNWCIIAIAIVLFIACMLLKIHRSNNKDK